MISAIIPISPIPSHPDTAILEETVESIRHHLPDTEIILTFDGVRPEQEHRRNDYEESIYRTLWLADHKWRNTCPIIFDHHTHQSGMIAPALDELHTPLLIYVEQDTPLVTNRTIDFDTIIKFIAAGHSNCVRLHHEATIPAEHRHMMHSVEDQFMRTSQWSQRPHIASAAFYRRIIDSHFTTLSHCFIEDVMHGILDEAHNIHGILGWDQYRTHIWHPDGDIKRSYHLDGRAGDPKYDETQIF